MAKKSDTFLVVYIALENGARVVADIHECESVAALYRDARRDQRHAARRPDLPDWQRPIEAKVSRVPRYTDRKGRIHRGKERLDARLSAAFSGLYARQEVA